MTADRPAATHRFTENNGDDCPLFVRKPGVFYALNSMATFVVDQHGVVWKYAAKSDAGAERIPLHWSEPPTYGVLSGGFIEPIANPFGPPVSENT
jgi:hypothetical protein